MRVAVACADRVRAQTEEAMWQQELENRRRRRIAQQEKRELQEYIKKQMAEQKERQRLERESWKSLAPAPRTCAFLTVAVALCLIVSPTFHVAGTVFSPIRVRHSGAA